MSSIHVGTHSLVSKAKVSKSSDCQYGILSYSFFIAPSLLLFYCIVFALQYFINFTLYNSLTFRSRSLNFVSPAGAHALEVSQVLQDRVLSNPMAGKGKHDLNLNCEIMETAWNSDDFVGAARRHIPHPDFAILSKRVNIRGLEV